MALKCSFCRGALKFAAAAAVMVAIAPVFVPAMVVYAYCSNGGNIKG